MCKNCQLRNALAATLDRPGETVRHHLERTFHINGKPIKKHLEYTTRPIVFRGREMTLFFVHDITDITLSRLELEEKQRQMEIDLAKAGEIQKALMLNQTPEIPAIRTGWYFSPSFKIGGDMFHIFEPAPGLVSAYMLDACGHGVSAALIAVTVKHFIDHLVAQDLTTGQTRTPGEVLRDLEKEFPFERFESHFTIIYLSLDCQSGELVYASAGHVPPVVTGPHERFDVLNEHGTIIGLGRNASQSGSRTKLTPGDKVLLYTDGLLDCFGPRGDIKNADRFYSAVKKNSILPADQLTAAVIDQQKALGQTAMADDDISLLAIEYLGLPG